MSRRIQKLGTYAAKCIENELLMLFRSRKKLSREISLYEPIGTDREGNEISLLDIIEGAEVDIARKMDLKTDIGRALSRVWGRGSAGAGKGSTFPPVWHVRISGKDSEGDRPR